MAAGRDGTFVIAHISDLHCGGPYFEPNLLERAISEVNDLEAGHRRVLRRPDDVRLQARVRSPARIWTSSSATRSWSSPATTIRATSANVHFEDLFGDRNSVLHKGRLRGGGRLDRAGPRPRPDRARPLSLDRGSVCRAARRSTDLVLHHHLLPVHGTGRERNVVYDAGDALECLQRAGVHLVLSGHKHVPYAWRLENLFVVNTGTVSSLRLRGNTRPRYNVVEFAGRHVSIWRRHPFHGQGADHPVLHLDVRVREVHGQDRARGHDAGMRRIPHAPRQPGA